MIDFLAPGLTTDAPHAMRAYTLLPVPQILTGFGIISSIGLLQKQSKGVAMGFIVLLSVIVLESLIQFFSNYFILFPHNQSKSFQYAISDTMKYVAQKKDKKIVISNKDNLYQSYMFYLFYSHFDPEKYQKLEGTKSGGFNEEHRIENISFVRNIFSTSDADLLVGNPYEFTSSAHRVMTFYYLNGSEGIIAVEGKK